jgi:hypothetical protein
MSDAPRRRLFTTIESDFLEAGEQMDLAAAAAVETSDVADEPTPASRWARFVTLAFGRWGVVALVGTGVFVIGGASFRAGPGTSAVTATLAVETATAHAAAVPVASAPTLPPDPFASEIAAPVADAVPTAVPIAETETKVSPTKPTRERPRTRARSSRRHR